MLELDSNGNITINPFLLSIEEFEMIWNRDKTKDKTKARKELTYIYALTSTDDNNIWKDYNNLKEREKIIIHDLFGEKGGKEWVPDRLINDALLKYKERIPKDPSELLLETLREAIEKIREHIKDIDYNEMDNNGRPKYNPKDILILSREATKTYIEMEDIIQKIKTKKRLNTDRIKGGSEEGLFEDDKLTSDLF